VVIETQLLESIEIADPKLRIVVHGHRKVGERTFTVRQLRDLVVIDGAPPAN
jgi:hypothetical protein